MAPRLHPGSVAGWPSPWLVSFRFCALYLGLYAVTTQMLGDLLAIPGVDLPDIGRLPPLRPLILGLGRKLLHATPVVGPIGSGDTTYDWLQLLVMLTLALVGTIVWSRFARDASHHDSIRVWLRLFIRFMLGSTLVHYGLIRVFPLQMPAPSLSRLLQPFGTFSPMGVIWSSMGAAEGYERFIGSFELVAGALLFLPGTALLGSLLAAGVTAGVFVVNMTYDVPVKLLSLHLVLMSAMLIAPERCAW